jgi:hypothetical protein
MRRWALLFTLLLAGCGGDGQSAAKTVWPAPPNAMERTREAGLTPETHEFVALHVHAHLDVFLNGERVVVPAGIGINIDDPAVKKGKTPDGSTGYGGINPPCAKPCISPLHTHVTDGILHTEAKKNQFNTLGEFFTEWNVRLDPSCVGNYCRPATSVAVYVNGEKYAGDPRQIKLTNAKEIAIVIGSPPDKIPSTPSG